jgi:exosortase
MMRAKLLALVPLLRSPRLLVAALACVCFLWAYGSTLAALAERWANSPHYSHGFLVPAFALVVLWFRRKQLQPDLLQVSAWGLPLLLAGGALRLAGAYFYYPALDSLSLLPSLVGLCVLLGGWAALRWTWPAIAFLLFMLPLPFVVEGALAQPLQRLATFASTYALQTIGFPAVAEGNIVIVNDCRIGVVEACNGLGMLVIFFAISTALAFVIKRPLWEKVLVVASAVPVALVANVARITTTAVLSEIVGQEFGQAVFHDWGGWLMMPLALSLLWLELGLLAWLFYTPAPTAAEPLRPVGLVTAPAPAPKTSRGKGKNRQRQPAKAPARPGK